MVILNEREYVRGIIERHNKNEKINLNKLITYIVKYYYNDYKDAALYEYIEKVLEVLASFEYSDIYYREGQKYDYIKKLCKKAQKGQLDTTFRELESVSVTEDEIQIIAKGKNDKEKKLLFTLYVLAKVYGYHSGWVNYPPSEIFKLANVTLKYEDRFLLIHELYKAKLIQLNHIIGKTGYCVELYEDSPAVITIPNKEYNKPDHFGNQYMAYIKGNNWRVCEKCGRLIKKKSNKQKYCKRCASDIKKKQISDWKKEKIENC